LRSVRRGAGFGEAAEGEEDEGQPGDGFEDTGLEGRVASEVAAVGEGEGAEERRKVRRGSVGVWECGSEFGAEEEEDEETDEEVMGDGFEGEGVKREMAVAHEFEGSINDPDRRIEKLGLGIGVEGITGEEAVGPERELAGGQGAIGDVAKDVELLSEVAVGKHGPAEEVPVEEEEPGGYQSDE
jgi:hypothetical protein